MLYMVWKTALNGDEYIAKMFPTEKEAQDWIWIRRKVDKVAGEYHAYWIEETL